MQQKHKRKSHPRPIVPVHMAASTAAKAGQQQAGSSKNISRARHSSQPNAQQHHVKPAGAAAAGAGKRQHADSAQPQPSSKKAKQQMPAPGNTTNQQQQQHAANNSKKAPQQPRHPAEQKQGRQQQPQKQQQQKQQQRHQQVLAGGAGNKKHSSKHKRERAEDAPAAVAKQAKITDSSTPQAAVATAAAAAAGAGAAAAVAAAAVAKPWHPNQAAAVGSNWQALKQQLAVQEAAKPKRPRRGKGVAADSAAGGAAAAAPKKQIGSIGHNQAVTPILAMDCEMVGVGPGGERDSLARVSVVNASGNVLYDSHVAQSEPVTDYRTWVSGITPANLVGAPPLSEVQAAVAELLAGRTLVGHGLTKDLAVLMLSHPRKSIRDTAKYPPFMFSKGGKRKPRALRHLALQELGLTIQEGEHSSVDDARAALYLYQKHAATWEKALKTHLGLKQLPTANRTAVKKKRIESYSARDVKDDPMADL